MNKAMTNQLLFVGVLGIGGYFFITSILPDLLKNLGKGAGSSAAGAATGIAEGAGTAAGGVVMAAPNAINSLVQYITGMPNSIQTFGAAIGRGIFTVFHPSGGVGDLLYYNVGFPDGQRHAVASSQVNSQGQFSYTGRPYQLVTGNDGMKYAAPM